MTCIQKEITISSKPRGFHSITDEVVSQFPDIGELQNGICQIFIKHTSASLCIQENASKDVMEDISNFFTKLVPENPSLYKHNIEGSDDMPAHIKSLLTQTSLTVPVKANQMDIGTWQGFFLFEHRIAPMRRKLNLTLVGI